MEKRKSIKRKILIIIGVLVILAIACDMRLKTIIYKIETPRITTPIRIALITDLHSDWYGKEQGVLIDALKKQQPDIVLLGGDIFDDKGSNQNAELTLQQLSEQYPCYYVTGNHEYWSGEIDNILEIVESYGISVLSGDCKTIEIKGQTINICGVDDPDVVAYTKNGIGMLEQLKAAEECKEAVNPKGYTILLSHRPEWVETYMQYDFDLVLCGHAHGGQWRIPGILNGLFAPNQGLFPHYAGGIYYYKEGKQMIVSRGLARESTPVPRIFNRPELVIIDLE